MRANQTRWRGLLVLSVMLAGWGNFLPAREWSDATGKFRVQAELVSVADGKAKLKLAEGRIIDVPVDRLSAADQKFIAYSQRPQVETQQAKEAEQLVDQAYALLQLDARNNANLIDAKLREAARLNPSNINAEFLRGIYHLLVSSDPDRAAASFEACLKQQPNHGGVLNNLALAKLKAGSFAPALDYFEKAVKVAPGLSAISQNLGRALHVHNDERLPMPERISEQFADLYSRVVASEKFPAAEPELGWVLVNVFSDREETPADSDLPEGVKQGGTGFVVHGDYIVTNRHVVDDAKTVKIRVPSRRGENSVLDGKVIAVSKDADVAIVECAGLSLPAAKVVTSVPRRGSDVMVLGFPQFSQLGSTIKSTRGAVTSLPAEATENMLLIDAEMNSGNSGGPIANKKGEVVAIATAVFKPRGGTGGRYGAGIPISTQLEFLKTHIPKFAASAGDSAELAWPDVDEQVSKSTVLVLVTGKPEAVQDEYAGMFFDITCPCCSGAGEVKPKFRRAERCPHCRGIGLDRVAVLHLAARRARLLHEQEVARNDRPSPNTPSEVTPGLKLISASYGVSGRTNDVTKVVGEALAKDPFLPIQPDGRTFGDPAQGQAKKLTITYSLDGKQQTMTLGEQEVSSFPPWPQEGKVVPDASVKFQIVAARYGAGLTWQDRTGMIRDRALHPAEEVHWAGVSLGDPWFGVAKRVVVWFDYGGRRFVRVFREGEFGRLLDSSAVATAPPRVEFKATNKAHNWRKEKEDVIDLMGADEKFFVISHLAGNFGGLGEEIKINPQSRRKWILNGKANQYVSGIVLEIDTALRKEFEPEVTEHLWTNGKRRIKMIHSSEGFCYLSHVAGNLLGGGEEIRVSIDPTDGFWYLACRTQQPMAASAIALKLKENSDVRLQYAEFEWTPTRKRIRMVSDREGFAVVSSLSGNFAGYGEQVEVTNKDGYWWLGGIGQKAITGRGYSVRVVPK